MTGLIGLAIIAIWLVVLVPMWLNRHEADDASRSVDTFSTAMRVLSRRSAASGDRRYVVMPRRDNWGLTVDNHPDAGAGRRVSPLRRSLQVTGVGSRERLLARRRRNALVLGAAIVLLGLTAALGISSWWYELAVDLAAAGYVIHLRNEAIRARELRHRRLARAARLAAPAEPARAEARAETAQRRRPPVEPFVGPDQVLPPVPVSATGTENGSRWEPVPVPLPTYVSKPVVARPAASAPRADVESTTIDLTKPGEWTDTQIDHRHLLLDETGSGRISASAGAPRAPGVPGVPGSELEDDELDLILQRRRAVGD
jgi:hypothetical protein